MLPCLFGTVSRGAGIFIITTLNALDIVFNWRFQNYKPLNEHTTNKIYYGNIASIFIFTIISNTFYVNVTSIFQSMIISHIYYVNIASFLMYMIISHIYIYYVNIASTIISMIISNMHYVNIASIFIFMIIFHICCVNIAFIFIAMITSYISCYYCLHLHILIWWYKCLWYIISNPYFIGHSCTNGAGSMLCLPIGAAIHSVCSWTYPRILGCVLQSKFGPSLYISTVTYLLDTIIILVRCSRSIAAATPDRYERDW